MVVVVVETVSVGEVDCSAGCLAMQRGSRGRSRRESDRKSPSNPLLRSEGEEPMKFDAY